MAEPNYVCPACGRPMMSEMETCSGGFLDDDHPAHVLPVVGSPPVRDDPDAPRERHEDADA